MCKWTRVDFIEEETVIDEEEPVLTDLFIGTISARQATIKDEDTSDMYIENMSTTTTNTRRSIRNSEPRGRQEKHGI